MANFSLDSMVSCLIDTHLRPAAGTRINLADGSLFIDGENTPVQIEYHWERGYPGDREQPEEPEGWQIDDVYMDVESIQTSIIAELSERQVGELLRFLP